MNLDEKFARIKLITLDRDKYYTEYELAESKAAGVLNGKRIFMRKFEEKGNYPKNFFWSFFKEIMGTVEVWRTKEEVLDIIQELGMVDSNENPEDVLNCLKENFSFTKESAFSFYDCHFEERKDHAGDVRYYLYTAKREEPSGGCSC